MDIFIMFIICAGRMGAAYISSAQAAIKNILLHKNGYAVNMCSMRICAHGNQLSPKTFIIVEVSIKQSNIILDMARLVPVSD